MNSRFNVVFCAKSYSRLKIIKEISVIGVALDAKDKRENSTRGLLSKRKQALLVSAVNGRRRVALPPTGMITLIFSGA